MCHILFIHSSVDGHLAYFHFLAVTDNTTVSICAQIFVWICVFISFEYVTRSGIPGSYGNFVFNLLRNWQTVFQSDCPILLSYQQWSGILYFPCPWQYFFLIKAILVGVKWCLIIQVLIYLSLMAVDIEHFFVCNYWSFMCFLKKKSAWYAYHQTFICLIFSFFFMV